MSRSPHLAIFYQFSIHSSILFSFHRASHSQSQPIFHYITSWLQYLLRFLPYLYLLDPLLTHLFFNLIPFWRTQIFSRQLCTRLWSAKNFCLRLLFSLRTTQENALSKFWSISFTTVVLNEHIASFKPHLSTPPYPLPMVFAGNRCSGGWLAYTIHYNCLFRINLAVGPASSRLRHSAHHTHVRPAFLRAFESTSRGNAMSNNISSVHS